MFRKIQYDSEDISCRYLTLGHFKRYFSRKFGSHKLPYGYELSEFLKKFNVANSYFKHIKKTSESSFGLIFINSMKDLFHPFDFQDESKEMGDILSVPYWVGYLIIESIDGFENIESFLEKEKGIPIFIQKITSIERRYKENLFRAFDRLSFYRTATNIIHNVHKINQSIPLTNGAVAKYLANYLEIYSCDLEDDMACLLHFHRQWKTRLTNQYKGMYQKPIKILEQDIWFLYEWLCSLCDDSGEKHYLNKWSQKHTRSDLGWSDINEIINYEEFEIENKFKCLIPHYCQLSIELKADDIFKQLSHHKSFWPWARAFYDMHNSLKTDAPNTFKQPRIIDSLIVITIRTEIVIRSIFSTVDSNVPNDLKELIRKIPDNVTVTPNERKMLLSAAGENWYLTDLRHQPIDIFKDIDACQTGKNCWGHNVRSIFKQILKFVTARNYFAHNFHKDDDLNYQTSDLAGDILKACIDSLLYFNHTLK